ncbi:trypsin-like serine peptidase [Streptomyces sp. NPDC088785]|uniref:trypsin-like serine peptidase n=1 Tax=Streptomyces sp. NPDC088785 TaxID=3365897 RepID=UPI0038281F57
MGQGRRRAAAAVAVAVVWGAVGCGAAAQAGPDGPQGAVARDAAPVTAVHEAAATKRDRRAVEAHWTGGGTAEVARADATHDPVQPPWTGGGTISRTVGRLYATSADGTSGACTATVVGTRTVVTAGHCVRTAADGVPARAATWDRNLYFVPGYRKGAAPYGGFTVRRVRMAADWRTDGLDVAMLTMNPGPDGRDIAGATGAQPIAFDARPAAPAHFFGYPYTDRVLHCSGAPTRTAGGALVRIPCLMGVGSSGGPYLSGGRVVAVNVASDADASYGTALGPFARTLYRDAEHG